MISRQRKKLREKTPSTIATNNIKYLRVTLTRQVKDLYDKNGGVWYGMWNSRRVDKEGNKKV